MSRYRANTPQIYARILIPSRSSAILFFPPPPILSKILALKSGTELEAVSVELRRMHRVLRQRRAGPALGRHPSMILGVTGKRDNAEKGRIVLGLVVFHLYSASYASFKFPWSPGRQSYPLPYLLHCLFFPDIRDLAMVRPCSFRRPHLSFASVQVSRAYRNRAQYLTFPSLLVGMLLWNYFLSVFTDPGGVPDGWVRNSSSPLFVILTDA